MGVSPRFSGGKPHSIPKKRGPTLFPKVEGDFILNPGGGGMGHFIPRSYILIRDDGSDGAVGGMVGGGPLVGVMV